MPVPRGDTALIKRHRIIANSCPHSTVCSWDGEYHWRHRHNSPPAPFGISNRCLPDRLLKIRSTQIQRQSDFKSSACHATMTCSASAAMQPNHHAPARHSAQISLHPLQARPPYTPLRRVIVIKPNPAQAFRHFAPAPSPRIADL